MKERERAIERLDQAVETVLYLAGVLRLSRSEADKRQVQGVTGVVGPGVQAQGGIKNLISPYACVTRLRSGACLSPPTFAVSTSFRACVCRITAHD